MEIAVTVQNVSVRIDGQTILDDISVTLPKGKITGILGPSGAGKTTFIRALIGRQRIQRGAIAVFGLQAGNPVLRSTTGYMTQSPAIYPDLTVAQNLHYFAQMMNLPKTAAMEAIKAVDLGQHQAKLGSKLSGGQRSRVSLAVALLGKPKLLVLDEPTVGIDPVLREQLWNQFRALAEQGTTILVTSHVMDEASRCDQLLLIRAGKLVANDTPHNLCRQTDTKDIEHAFLKLAGGVK